jgi:hypothetical protein
MSPGNLIKPDLIIKNCQKTLQKPWHWRMGANDLHNISISVLLKTKSAYSTVHMSE